MNSLRPRHAFTVIELLVVIAIVLLTVIMTFSMAVFPWQREKPRRTACMNNLKQIGLACKFYAADNGERLPSWETSVFLNVMLMSNQLSPKVLVCPSSSKMWLMSFSETNATDVTNVSYTQQGGTSTRMIWRSNAGEVLFWDQGVAGNACTPTGGVGLNWAKTSNHKTAGGNVLFNDGHVAFHTKTPTNMPLGCLNP